MRNPSAYGGGGSALSRMRSRFSAGSRIWSTKNQSITFCGNFAEAANGKWYDARKASIVVFGFGAAGGGGSSSEGTSTGNRMSSGSLTLRSNSVASGISRGLKAYTPPLFSSVPIRPFESLIFKCSRIALSTRYVTTSGEYFNCSSKSSCFHSSFFSNRLTTLSKISSRTSRYDERGRTYGSASEAEVCV